MRSGEWRYRSVELVQAQAGKLRVGRLLLAGKVRIAVPELRREVELEALGELDGRPDGVGVALEAGGRVGRRQQHELLVAAPLGLAAVECDAVPDRDECVLEMRAPWVVSVDVAGRHGPHAECAGQVAQRRVSAGVARR